MIESRTRPPTVAEQGAVPRLPSAIDARERTALGIMVGAARTPAAAAPPESPGASEQTEAPVPPTSPIGSSTSPTSTHRGLPAVPRERPPGPTADDYAQLLALHRALEERNEELIERNHALADQVEEQTVRAVFAERQLAHARHRVARAEAQTAEVPALRDELRRSQAARDAALLLITEVLLAPPDSDLFRRVTTAALAAIAVARTAEPPTTAGGAT